jgi:MoxR-like ATPase
MTRTYTGSGARTPDAWLDLKITDPTRARAPEGYVALEDMVAAVNVALALGQPLLLTGEPGTGKTQLAYSVAWELGFDDPLKFETKSTTESRDLFYTFDTVGRFHARQAEEGAAAGELAPSNPLRFITYNALGLAIIRANPLDAVRSILPPGFEHNGPRRSVVLIDEIDKAPRDVPNDILNEIETMSFRIPELNVNRLVSADAASRPVVFITSNSEKALPDAFLRRCVYYHVPFPDAKTLEKIVHSRIGQRYAVDPKVKRALSLFQFVRDPALNLRKRPATAELIDWLGYLCRAEAAALGDADQQREFQLSFGVQLLKNVDDQGRAKDLFEAWKKRP